MRLTRLSLLAFFCMKLASATAIVAALFPDAIYIAADSRYTQAAGDAPAATDGCKIVRTGDVAFAAASLSKDTRTGFDFYAITRQALLRARGPLAMRLDAVDGQLRPRLRKTVLAIRQDFPEVYESFLNGHLGQAVFATWENDHPVMIEDDWKITKDGQIMEERPFPGNDDSNLVILGSGSDAIVRYADEHPDWSKLPVADALSHLIQAAIDGAAESSQTPDVGGDISILMIDAMGQHWVNPGRCGT
jgi:hypothetical protein